MKKVLLAGILGILMVSIACTSAPVAKKLIEKGFNAKALEGGWREWSEANYPVGKK